MALKKLILKWKTQAAEGNMRKQETGSKGYSISIPSPDCNKKTPILKNGKWDVQQHIIR